MYLLAPACEAIAATTKKLEKTRIVAEYLRSRTPEEAAVSAVFLSGRAFPAYQETTLQLGGTQLWKIVQELSGKSESAMAAAYRKHGDLGAAAYDVLAARYKSAPPNPLNVIAVKEIFEQIARTRPRVALQSHTPRSQVLDQDHDRQPADRHEGEPGGGRDR